MLILEAVAVVVRSTIQDLLVEKCGNKLEVNWKMLDCVDPCHGILQKE